MTKLMNKKQEIKKKIDLINKGEIPDGYKKTHGFIHPIDWNNLSFNRIFKERCIKVSDTSKYPLYSLTIENGVIPKIEQYERSFLITKDEDSYKVVKHNDFVYNPMNLRFGAIARYKDEKDCSVSGYYNVFNIINECNPYFMECFVKSQAMLNYYNTQATGSLIEKQRVHFSQFKEFNFALPSQKEQEKIAEILSYCDKVIELKEKLIDKKTKQKQYVMNKLFTANMGKPYILGKLGTTYAGLSEKNKDDFGFGSKFIPYTNIFTNIFVNINNLEYVNIQEGEIQSKVKYGDIFFTTSSECPEEVGMASVLLDDIEDLYLNSFCFGYRLNNFDILLPEYAGYLFRNNYSRSILNKLAQGMTRFNLSKNELMKETIYIPDIKTQKYYVDIFKNLDNELNLAKKELEQYKQLKKSLSQLLLTGIVRTI